MAGFAGQKALPYLRKLADVDEVNNLARSLMVKYAKSTHGSNPEAGAIFPSRSMSETYISGFKKHGIDRVIDRGISPKSLKDAITNPLEIKSIKIDELGRPSQKIIGREVEIVINPQTREVISVNPTSTKKAERLLRQLDRQ